MTNYWDTPEDELHYQRQIAMERGVRVKRAGTWFYWIAGLSFFNAVLILSNLGFVYLAGLGVTNVFYSLAEYAAIQSPGNTTLTFFMAFLGLSAAASTFYVLLGKYVKESHTWALYVGTAIYAMDMLFLFWYADLMGMIFHIFVIVQLVRGIIALQQLLNGPDYDDTAIRRAEQNL